MSGHPHVHISVGWAPYRNGRWTWIGGDYVWIAFEPWGWAPYHYGRWTFLASFGWCWVPPDRGDVYWGPGYVGWVYTPTYVSWVPLAPREIYYGYGNYGRHSVNIVNVNINTIVVKNVYRNVSVSNAVTVVHRDTFLKGKREDFRLRENPFLKERISVGRPAIAPERATKMPVIKEIPRAKEPPARVRDIKVREIKEKRLFVKEREKSVLLPQASQKSMPLRTVREPKTGGSVRAQEPERVPARQRIQPSETERPVKTIPEKGREIRQAPAEKKAGQSGVSTGLPPATGKQYPQGSSRLRGRLKQNRKS